MGVAAARGVLPLGLGRQTIAAGGDPAIGRRGALVGGREALAQREAVQVLDRVEPADVDDRELVAAVVAGGQARHHGLPLGDGDGVDGELEAGEAHDVGRALAGVVVVAHHEAAGGDPREVHRRGAGEADARGRGTRDRTDRHRARAGRLEDVGADGDRATCLGGSLVGDDVAGRGALFGVRPGFWGAVRASGRATGFGRAGGGAGLGGRAAAFAEGAHGAVTGAWGGTRVARGVGLDRAQGGGEMAHRGEAFGGDAAQGGGDDVLEAGGEHQLGGDAAQRGGLAGEHLMHELGAVEGGEGRGAGEQLEEDDAGGVDVDADVDGLADQLFGRHVPQGAEQLALEGEVGAGVAGQLGEAEVEDLDEVEAAAVDAEAIGGLEIAVDDAAVVGGLQGVADLEEDRLHARPGEAVLAGADRRERLAAQEVHRVVGPAVGELAGVDDVDDVGMIDGGGDLDLPQEALGDAALADQPHVHDLHGEALAEVAVPHGVDRAERALADLLDHVVAVSDASTEQRIARHGASIVPGSRARVMRERPQNAVVGGVRAYFLRPLLPTFRRPKF